MVPYLMSLLLLVFSYPGIHQLDWEAHQNQPPAVKGWECLDFFFGLCYDNRITKPLQGGAG